jgi:tetratricopeptide (TPR) repeat protein
MTLELPVKGTTMRYDTHHNPITGTAEAVEHYDAAVDRLIRYDMALLEQLERLVAEHPTFAMGQALAAYLHLTSTDQADLGAARTFAEALAVSSRNDRETAHAATIDAWLDGDWHGAAQRLDDLLVEWPTDVLALMIGHQLDFFVGDARNLRDRIGRSLGAFDPDHPHRAFARGMQAFGLEESGDYAAAEAAALEALHHNPDDVWALHAGAHVFEMQGRVDEGLAFMESRVADWGEGNLFTVHNWWHLALYNLEQGRHDRVLEIYDRQVHHDGSDGVPLELVDASAMLWRLHLDGVDVGNRFDPIADAWAGNLEGVASWYAFNDVHAVMAFIGAGRIDTAAAVVGRLTADVDTPVWRSNHSMTAEVGLPVSRALVAFGQGRYDEAVDHLWPARRTFHRFGGSHAQRDALERTLVEAAVRAGRGSLVERLVSERLAVRPNGRFALDRRPAGVARVADPIG